VLGREGTSLELRSNDNLEWIRSDDGRLELHTAGDCSILAPPAARLEVESVGGDARLNGLQGELFIRRVGGDLDLRRVGRASVEVVGGGLVAWRLGGDLTVDRVGGGAVIAEVAGHARLRSVGGDLRLRRADLGAWAEVGGEARLTLAPGPGWKGSVASAGDILLRLGSGSSLAVKTQAAGDVRVPHGLTASAGPEAIRFGAGEGELELRAGGSIRLVEVDRGEVDRSAGWEEQILGGLEEALGRIEFGRPAEVNLHVDTDLIRARVQRALEKAFDRTVRRMESMAGPTTPGRDWAAGEPGGEERLAILRMLENGKISVQEAESLLRALEGRA
jgi:hypothetical protein